VPEVYPEPEVGFVPEVDSIAGSQDDAAHANRDPQQPQAVGQVNKRKDK